jgi:hypothetical protein
VTVLLDDNGTGVATVIEDAVDDWTWIRGDSNGASIYVCQ